MLVLTRKAGQSITIKTPGGDVRVFVLRKQSGEVRLGIDAPADYRISRDDRETKGAA